MRRWCQFVRDFFVMFRFLVLFSARYDSFSHLRSRRRCESSQIWECESCLVSIFFSSFCDFLDRHVRDLVFWYSLVCRDSMKCDLSSHFVVEFYYALQHVLICLISEWTRWTYDCLIVDEDVNRAICVVSFLDYLQRHNYFVKFVDVYDVIVNRL